MTYLLIGTSVGIGWTQNFKVPLFNGPHTTFYNFFNHNFFEDKKLKHYLSTGTAHLEWLSDHCVQKQVIMKCAIKIELPLSVKKTGPCEIIF